MIGEIEMIDDDVTVTVRGYTLIRGERLTSRMQESWTSIPHEFIVEMATNIIDRGPRWDSFDLRIVLRII